MSRLQIGVVRYASVGAAIARALGTASTPSFEIGRGRITLTFRGLGASRWPENDQIEYAHSVAEVARAVLREDKRAAIRRRAGRAIVIVFEDSRIMRGSAVTSRWECVAPAADEST